MSIAKEHFLAIQSKYFDQKTLIQNNNQTNTIILEKYDWPSNASGGTEWLITHRFVKEALRILKNDINSFRKKILICETWFDVYNNLHEEEKMSIFFESINDHYISALLYPYALRQRFLYFSANILHLTMKIIDTSWSESKLKDFISQDVLEKFSTTKFKSLDNYKESLNKIDDDDHQKKTLDFRRKLQHKDPVQIEFGLSSLISRQIDKTSISYKLGSIGPLKMDVVLSEIKKQHRCAIITYESMLSLLDEILDIWRRERPYENYK